MAAENAELLLKCLELTKHIVDRNMMCFIDIKMGEGKSDFKFTFNNGLKKRLSPSQEKRNILRKQEYMKKKVKDEFEEQINESEVKVVNNIEKVDTTVRNKKKVLKFEVAAHMRVAAEKVPIKSLYC